MVATRILLLPVTAAFLIGFAPSPAAVAQTEPPAPPSATDTAKDPFGEEVTLPGQTIVYVEGSGMWDSAYQTIVAAFKTVNQALDKLGIKPDGAPMTIYTDTNDSGFKFQAAVPVKTAPSLPPESEIKVGKAPDGPALKFVHRGSYDSVDQTYEAISDRLDEKRLEAKELLIERYMKDLTPTQEDDLVIEIYVPLKRSGSIGAEK